GQEPRRRRRRWRWPRWLRRPRWRRPRRRWRLRRRRRLARRPLVDRAESFPCLLHTEASLGFGGQEIRILAESRWLATRGWRVLLAVQPDSRLLVEAARADLRALTVRMRGAWDVAAIVALR